jgi:hypothetical protein
MLLFFGSHGKDLNKILYAYQIDFEVSLLHINYEHLQYLGSDYHDRFHLGEYHLLKLLLPRITHLPGRCSVLNLHQLMIF